MDHKDKKSIKFVKRQDPEHPYCTNWLMTSEEEKEEEKEEGIQSSARVPEQPVGWIEAELPKSVMSRLESYIEVAEKNPTNINNTLAGNISKSLAIKDKDNWFFERALIPLIGEFMGAFPKYTQGINNLTENVPYCLNTFWVNFQKQHEFSPPHNHNALFAFVIWVKIPTDWKEQHALPFSANSNMPKASNFEFQYTSILGQHRDYSYFLDKEAEGHMLLFPAQLMHTVYPFYNCDKERISISGNICFDISENSMKQFRSQMKGRDDQK